MRIPLDIVPVFFDAGEGVDTYRVEIQRTPGDPATAAYSVTLHGGYTAPSVTADRETLVQLLDRIRAAITPPMPTRGNYAGSLTLVHAVAVPEVDGGDMEVRRVPAPERADRRTYEITLWPAANDGRPESTVQATWQELAAAAQVLLNAALGGGSEDE